MHLRLILPTFLFFHIFLLPKLGGNSHSAAAVKRTFVSKPGKDPIILVCITLRKKDLATFIKATPNIAESTHILFSQCKMFNILFLYGKW